ncbi:hypothetical protein N7470_006317 [Penicillium chermesinum]|nr:hypothetical protein N7470_006317 [Penicillium chermesinum]
MAIDNTVPATLPNPPKRLLLVSVPRTASNLLSKMLNIEGQPNVHTNAKAGYFFYNAFTAIANGGYLSKPCSQWTESEKTEVRALFQTCFNELEDYCTEAEATNKIMFAKEHSFWFSNPAALQPGVYDTEFAKALHVDIPARYGEQTYSANNQTVISDEYLRTWQLAFIIRHPALAWPSLYRAMLKMQAIGFMDEDGLKGGQRDEHDHALEPEAPDIAVAPPIIDAHDLIHTPQIVQKLCAQTGLDPASVQFEWGSADIKKAELWAPGAECDAEQQKHIKAANIMLSTLQSSSTPNKALAPETIDIAAEAVKWRAEFGDEIAGVIEKAVHDSMDDYEYLKARKLCL